MEAYLIHGEVPVDTDCAGVPRAEVDEGSPDGVEPHEDIVAWLEGLV